MAHIVVAYPSLSQEDTDWIAAFRAEHDRDYVSVIGPHYTLVFPTHKQLSHEDLTRHIERNAPPAFETRCRSAEVVFNPFINKWHVFLVPQEGYDEIVSLHGGLYSGPLEDQLHPTEPFIPHIGIATLETREECERLAETLNANGLDVRAAVREIDLCVYDGVKVTTTAKIPLR
jgi:hypothetical protein